MVDAESGEAIEQPNDDQVGDKANAVIGLVLMMVGAAYITLDPTPLQPFFKFLIALVAMFAGVGGIAAGVR